MDIERILECEKGSSRILHVPLSNMNFEYLLYQSVSVVAQMSLTAEEVDQLFPVAHLSAAFSGKVMEFFVHYTRENGGSRNDPGLGSLFNSDDYDSLM